MPIVATPVAGNPSLPPPLPGLLELPDPAVPSVAPGGVEVTYAAGLLGSRTRGTPAVRPDPMSVRASTTMHGRRTVLALIHLVDVALGSTKPPGDQQDHGERSGHQRQELHDWTVRPAPA